MATIKDVDTTYVAHVLAWCPCAFTVPAEQLYLSHGYERVGVIPDYAYSPEGVLEGTVLMYRRLNS